MFSLQSLRNAHRLTRFVLVWFALFVGAALASPLVKPEAVQLVCTAIGGVKLVQVDAAGAEVDGVVAHTALDCPAGQFARPALASPRTPHLFRLKHRPLKRWGAESVSASLCADAPRLMGIAVRAVCAPSSVR